MRSTLLAHLLVVLSAAPALAQEHGEKVNLLSPHGGLMFWTLLIFLVLFAILAKYAFPPIVAAVEQRERALEEAIEGAKRDREEAARFIEEQRALVDAARAEAQKLIADGRKIGEKLRADMVEQTHAQQQEMLERARREIQSERDRAIEELRREAVDLAIAGASKVIEKDLDEEGNRRLVETFLSSLKPLRTQS
jgi:F-type H+-transporting ATPase subunit b